MICPICLNKSTDRDDLEIHVKKHGYDDIQTDILLAYNANHKSLIENVQIPDLSICLRDDRYKTINSYFNTIYSFMLPSEFEYDSLLVKKSYHDILALYKDILCARLFDLKLLIDSEPKKSISIYKFEFTSLYELLDDLLLLKEEAKEIQHQKKFPFVRIDGSTFYFSWDNIEFENGKVVVHIPNTSKHYTFKNNFASVLYNIINDYFFKVKYKDKYFSIFFENEHQINRTKSSIYQLEELLKLEQINITDSLQKLEIMKNGLLKIEKTLPLNKYKIKKSEYKKFDKNEFIKAAISYCSENDNVFVIQENNNGKLEQNVMIEYIRRNYIHVLVENEELNRSAHLYIFEKNSIDHLQKLYGFYFSDKENKRMHILTNRDVLKEELNAVSRIRVLRHHNMVTYKENIQHYLYMLG